jgi:hypothetical protein
MNEELSVRRLCRASIPRGSSVSLGWVCLRRIAAVFECSAGQPLNENWVHIRGFMIWWPCTVQPQCLIRQFSRG